LGWKQEFGLGTKVAQSELKLPERAIPTFFGKFGWGGRIRTFTVLINSEVSYQLDHAPAGDRGQRVIRRELKLSSRKNGREVSL
jgi:hypothetical protein